MGYTTAYHHVRTDAEAARYALRQVERAGIKVLAFSTDRHVIGHGYGFVTYAAVEVVENDRRDVICMTVLQHRTDSEVGWKFVDETMGPNNERCPIAILNMLTPPQNDYAASFRKASRLFNEGRVENVTLHTGEAA